MGTRCQVIVRDSDGGEQWFYRHSDGYPSGVKPTLLKFVELVENGKIRDNVEQGAGWLILLGAIEYQTIGPDAFLETDKRDFGHDRKKVSEVIKSLDPDDWKCGAYEPCVCKGPHGDIAHLYLVDLSEPALYEVGLGDNGKEFSFKRRIKSRRRKTSKKEE